jgi:uncharacterized protein (TIGR02246 family)
MPEPLSLQDRVDVTDLVARYAQYFDLADREAFLGLFTPDASVQLTTGARHEGLQAIGGWFDTLLAAGRIGASAPSRHLMGLPVIRGDSERCSVRTGIAHFGVDAEGKVKTDVNSSEDVCIKVDGRWLLQSRVLARDVGSR